jgi:YHS domain-containing protein
MSILLISVLSVFLFTSCAHHNNDTSQQQHKEGVCKLHKKKIAIFDKNCNQLASEGDFKLNHRGKVYFFSTKEKMDKFKVKLKQSAMYTKSRWGSADAR